MWRRGKGPFRGQCRVSEKNGFPVGRVVIVYWGYLAYPRRGLASPNSMVWGGRAGEWSFVDRSDSVNLSNSPYPGVLVGMAVSRRSEL